MTRLGTRLGKSLARTTAATLITCAAALATSCGSVFDDLPPCRSGVELRFIFDHNMEEANSFHKQVDCLTLYLYGSDGRLIATYGEDSGALASEDYRMDIDLDPGHYRAVAYGGMRCADASFEPVPEPAAGSTARRSPQAGPCRQAPPQPLPRSARIRGAPTLARRACEADH